MITDAIASILLSVLTFFINLFPAADTSVSTTINNMILTLRNLIVGANFLFPIDTLILLLNLSLTIISLMFAFKLGRWLLSNLSGGLFK